MRFTMLGVSYIALGAVIGIGCSLLVYRLNAPRSKVVGCLSGLALAFVGVSNCFMGTAVMQSDPSLEVGLLNLGIVCECVGFILSGVSLWRFIVMRRAPR